MIEHEFLQDDSILIIEPEAALRSSDFDMLSSIVDPYIQANGKLNGLAIHAELFPGWKDFASLLTHIKSVKDHHTLISKVAVAALPAIAARFVKADVSHSGYDGLYSAIERIRTA